MVFKPPRAAHVVKVLIILPLTTSVVYRSSLWRNHVAYVSSFNGEHKTVPTSFQCPCSGYKELIIGLIEPWILLLGTFIAIDVRAIDFGT